ncbi:MAG: hypothetical protein R3B48_23955 [Kofleriaceae bacterium]
MSMIRCNECHATILVPEALEASTMKCSYCGAVLQVPDFAARQQAWLAQRREEREQRVAEVAAHLQRERDAHERRREREDRKARRSEVRWGRVMTLLSMLAAPVIISITVFDLPARLGFGGAGADRVAIVATQLGERGCQPLGAPTSEYTSGTVSRLVRLEGEGCLRIVAAGGPGHSSLTLRVFDLDGKQVAKSPSTGDPQVEFCPKSQGSLRYEIVAGAAAKGRLTHVALRCPAKGAEDAEDAEDAEPAPRRAPRKSGKR